MNKYDLNNLALSIKEAAMYLKEKGLNEDNLRILQNAADMLILASYAYKHDDVDCNICGDYHETDSVPTTCANGDGE